MVSLVGQIKALLVRWVKLIKRAAKTSWFVVLVHSLVGIALCHPNVVDIGCQHFGVQSFAGAVGLHQLGRQVDNRRLVQLHAAGQLLRQQGFGGFGVALVLLHLLDQHVAHLVQAFHELVLGKLDALGGSRPAKVAVVDHHVVHQVLHSNCKDTGMVLACQNVCQHVVALSNPVERRQRVDQHGRVLAVSQLVEALRLALLDFQRGFAGSVVVCPRHFDVALVGIQLAVLVARPDDQLGCSNAKVADAVGQLDVALDQLDQLFHMNVALRQGALELVV